MGFCAEYKDYFKLGAAVNTRSIKHSEKLITDNFTTVTCENEMKPASVHPADGVWTFEGADLVADFARKNGLVMRGHTLVWHNQTAPWFLEGSRAEIQKRLAEHMRTEIDRYKDVVWCWDVVNEAVSDRDGGGVLRESKWKSAFGEDYVENAFITAKEAAVETGADFQLVYNDYNTVIPSKRERILKLVDGMLKKNVPVDAVGMQGHWNLEFPDASEIRKTIEAIAGLGLRVHVTELDISVHMSNDAPELKFADMDEFAASEIFARQKARYREIFDIFKEYKDAVDCVVTWGVADDATWLDGFPVRGRKNYPLLFDMNHNEKF